MRRPKLASARPEAPKPGDYVASMIFGRDHHVTLKGEGSSPWDSSADKRISGCATMRGAERLAKLLNAVRDLGTDWHIIANSAPIGGDAEEWAKVMIACAVVKALGLEHDPEANAGVFSLRLADTVPLTLEEKAAQAARCPCITHDAYCCQEIQDEVTRKERRARQAGASRKSRTTTT